MNPKLPKSMHDALAREAATADHPSADVLTAFAENTLPGPEHRRIADHLARCGDCREVVFLAVDAEDRPLPLEQRLVAAAHGAERRWMPRLAWGMSIVACVFVTTSAWIWWRIESAPPRMQMASGPVSVPAAQPAQPAQESQPATESKPETELNASMESKLAPAPQSRAELAAPPPPAKAQARTPQARTVVPKSVSPKLDAIGTGSNAGVLVNESSAQANIAKTATAAEPTTITVGAATGGSLAPAAPAPHANAFAGAQGGPTAAAPGSANTLLLNRQDAARSLRAAHPQWRILADGQLEHLTLNGWSRVLANEKASFRVVSVVGNQVWVGGSSGALFHSRDEGQNWEQVALSTPTGRETATIVSIQFDDPQHGTITTDSGVRCATTDGGSSWSCSAVQQ
jgi:hypothetical protein